MSEAFIKTKNEFYRNPKFIEFRKSIKSMVYEFLQAAIIRGSKEVRNPMHGAFYIYKQHFLKGQLVSRYSQKKMAEYLKTSQSAISRYLKDLEEEGFIKKFTKKTQYGIACYYQMGTWEGEYGKKSYKEIIWHNSIFSLAVLIQQKSELKAKAKLADEEMEMSTQNWDPIMLDEYEKMRKSRDKKLAKMYLDLDKKIAEYKC